MAILFIKTKIFAAGLCENHQMTGHTRLRRAFGLRRVLWSYGQKVKNDHAQNNRGRMLKTIDKINISVYRLALAA